MKNKWNKRLHTPSLYLCTSVIYRTVRHEKRCIATPSLLLIAFLIPHCPVTVVQRYRDGCMQPLVPLICHPYIPLHLEEMTCFIDFGCANAPSTICIIHATIISLWWPLSAILALCSSPYFLFQLPAFFSSFQLASTFSPSFLNFLP